MARAGGMRSAAITAEWRRCTGSRRRLSPRAYVAEKQGGGRSGGHGSIDNDRIKIKGEIDSTNLDHGVARRVGRVMLVREFRPSRCACMQELLRGSCT